MTKDRFKEMQGRSGVDDGENENLMPEVSVESIKNNINRFQKLKEKMVSIQFELEETKEKVGKVKSQQNSILSATADISNAKLELDSLIKTITKTMSKIGKDLKETNKVANGDRKGKKISETEFRMICTFHTSLTTRFQNVWEELCVDRDEYERKCKLRIQRQLEIAGYIMTEEEKEQAMETGLLVFSKEFQETQAARLALRDLEDRHQELLELEKSLKEMADMFVELNLLVQTQGETIDTIEANMAQAEVKVASGNVELGNAKRKQKTARKRKFICIAAISGVLLLAIIIALASIFG